MDSRLTGLSEDNDPSMGSGQTTPHIYTEKFYEAFPYYLSIGMSSDEFWNGDCRLAKSYREADLLRRERSNYDAWLQGMYIYDALARLQPVFQAFAKKGTKAKPYVSEPYALTEERVNKQEEKKEKQKMDKGKRFMEMFSSQFNRRFDNGNEH